MDKAVSSLIEAARAAQRRYETWDQAGVDAVVTAAGWAIMEPGRNRALAEMAVRDTGLGVVEDKVTKNHRKTLGLLRDLKGAKSVGVIAEYPERGIVEIARPVGVVAAARTLACEPVATTRSACRIRAWVASLVIGAGSICTRFSGAPTLASTALT